jgi:dTMP kinase
MKIKKPLLIAFEGIDGSGKTTVSRRLWTHLNETGNETVWLREPGDSKWGKKIRELANLKESIPIEEELKYFIEDRKINVKENIIPALEQGKSVIVDRYYLSSACYQGARNGFDMFDIIERNLEFAPVPDITFIVDVDVDTALTRIRSSRETEAKLFEKREFLQKVRENYLKLKDDGKVRIIDGTDDPDTVFNRIIDFFISFY